MLIQSDSFARFCAAFAVTALLSGCVVPEDVRGTVTQYNGDSVTIRGAFSMDGSPARPTAGMAAQAREVCPGAKYISADPASGDDYSFLYLFKCR